MRRASSQTLIQRFQESDREEQARNESKKIKLKDERKTQQRIGDRIDDITQQVTCMTIYKRKGEEFSWENHGLHRQEMRTRAARLEKQLKARWSIEQLIDEQLSHFRAIYIRVPTTMKDVTQLLMPKEASAHELAATSWLGDWRPTMILELSRSLIQSSSDSAGLEQVLLQLINDVRIQEAVIDEEMAEIQATCVLHLPFSPLRVEGSGPPLARMQSEFKKIHRVVTKAQNLRCLLPSL
ncbi:uncharacterized protein LOC111372164 isoform X2 [Olea europaea subsp. europaea]|uniref:Uncharacterized protein LOC111372164 isoform X2 n=1 Tax=Olea europaea subsp. europaea TaxID=158383 RepID=A0A8S0VM03_OLEEU|nr:uncharacterized protein LOC111372164 isoform X2 [Olea europaea subsp. europaea]